jgi:hypothetical protein
MSRPAARCVRECGAMQGRAAARVTGDGICIPFLGWAVSTKADMPCSPIRYVSAQVSEFPKNNKNRILPVGDRPRGPLKQWGSPHLNPCFEIS